MKEHDRERRDWALIIFIIPIGILLILIVGQLAVKMVPHWSVKAGMRSNMDPETDSIKPIAFLPPLLPQVLTPMAWAENFLTPIGEVSFPPFIVIEPTSTPSPEPTEKTPTELPTIVTVTLSTTPTPPATLTFTPMPPTVTPEVTDSPVATDTPTSFPTDTPTSVPTNTPTSIPTDTPTATPTSVPTDTPTATPIPLLCQDSSATNYGNPLPCTYAPSETFVDPAPTEIGVGTMPDNSGPGGAGLGYILDGTYIVIKLSVTVSTVPDGNYDLVYYEYNFNNTGNIHLDNIIIGISNVPDGSQYYEVFNWGDWNGVTGNIDTNTNVGDVAQAAGSEVDNANIPTSELYDPDAVGPAQQTGILIDVDNPPNGAPPPATYDYVVVISPANPVGDPAGVDAIATVEEPIPTPTP